MTYTFTDISSGFFESGSEVFSAYKDRMIFKTFDCGQDPVMQGYNAGTYDVVVASLVIHATPDLDVTMRNLRKLLKPGGFLVVADGTNNGQPHGTGGFIFGPLPGWWLGVDSGRPLSPFVSTAEWERLLTGNGFSGIDSTAPKAFEDIIGMTVFASQAVDDKISFLREPLDPEVSSHSTFTPIEDLVIVGGSTPGTRPLVKSVQESLKAVSSQLRAFETMAAIDYNSIDADTTVVCLTELDKPVFKDITPDEFLTFKTIFSATTKLLWVTGGRLADEPFSNMTIGFARTAVHEIPALQFQSVDITDIRSLEPRSLVEMILRFEASTGFNDTERDHLLWAIEPEVVLDAEGQELVPRLRPIATRNDRYNSVRRPITHELDVSKSPAVLNNDADGWSLREVSKWGVSTDLESQTRLEVSYAVVSALRTSHGHKFLVLGTEPQSQSRYLALVPSLLSVVHVPKDSAVLCSVSATADADLLTTLAARLIAMAVVDPLVAGETLLVHNPTNLLAQALAAQASTKDVRIFFVADASRQHVPESWITLAPYMTQSEIAEALPTNVACFVGHSGESENESTILASLPPHCRKETMATLYSAIGWDGGSSSAAVSGQLLHRALDQVQMDASQDQILLSETIDINDLINGSSPQSPSAVVDWKLSSSFPVKINRLDSAAFFKSDKTYWMCGLSGALGVSLCDWMIEKGARYLVLTSRNPNISPDWIKAHAQNGVKVTIVPW